MGEIGGQIGGQRGLTAPALAIGDQNHMALQVFGLMTGGIVVGYAKSAYFALVMTAMGPLIGFGAGLWFWA